MVSESGLVLAESFGVAGALQEVCDPSRRKHEIEAPTKPLPGTRFVIMCSRPLLFAAVMFVLARFLCELLSWPRMCHLVGVGLFALLLVRNHWRKRRARVLSAVSASSAAAARSLASLENVVAEAIALISVRELVSRSFGCPGQGWLPPATLIEHSSIFGPAATRSAHLRRSTLDALETLVLHMQGARGAARGTIPTNAGVPSLAQLRESLVQVRQEKMEWILRLVLTPAVSDAYHASLIQGSLSCLVHLAETSRQAIKEQLAHEYSVVACSDLASPQWNSALRALTAELCTATAACSEGNLNDVAESLESARRLLVSAHCHVDAARRRCEGPNIDGARCTGRLPFQDMVEVLEGVGSRDAATPCVVDEDEGDEGPSRGYDGERFSLFDELRNALALQPQPEELLLAPLDA